MKTTNPDALTARATAFGSFADLTAACAAGYVPTLMTEASSRMGRSARRIRSQHVALAEALTAQGHRYFPREVRA